MDGTLHTAERDREAERWHYHPKGPVPLNPLFSWPPRPAAVLRWYRGAWMEITSLTLCFLLALAVYAWMLPPLAEMGEFRPGWMLRVWLANLLPQAAVAGGLHWWLYMRKGQGMQKKFDKRDLSRGNGTFTFKNQVLDNIWWTLGSAITVATVYQWGIYWLMANGWVPVVTFAEAPVWCVVWMLFIPMWSGLHFYWVHRLEHHPKLYKHVHAVHHRNVNIGPWSGISNHWYENLLYFTTYFIHLIVPSHPLHLLPSTAMFQQISPVSLALRLRKTDPPRTVSSQSPEISSTSCTTAISNATTAPRKFPSTSGSAPTTTAPPQRQNGRGPLRSRCTLARIEGFGN